jgi:hypothetical protein
MSTRARGLAHGAQSSSSPFPSSVTLALGSAGTSAPRDPMGRSRGGGVRDKKRWGGGLLSDRECCEVLGCVSLFLVAATALVLLHMGSHVTLCRFRADDGGAALEGILASVPALQPCVGGPFARGVFAKSPSLLQMDSKGYARSLVSLARTHAEYGSPAPSANNNGGMRPLLRERLSGGLERSGGGKGGGRRPWFDALNGSVVPCDGMAAVGGAQRLGERKLVCGAAGWPDSYMAAVAWAEGEARKAGGAGGQGEGEGVSGEGDPSAPSTTAAAGCAVLSIGSANDFFFEDDTLTRLPSCHIFTLDCTLDPARFGLSSAMTATGRLHPVHLCVDDHAHEAPAIITKVQPDGSKAPLWVQRYERMEDVLGGRMKGGPAGQPIPRRFQNAPLWKVDCEGCEYAIADSLLGPAFMRRAGAGEEGGQAQAPPPLLVPPQQIAVEVHTTARPQTCASEDATMLFAKFAAAGYVIVNREDNPTNDFVSEFTLVRAFC